MRFSNYMFVGALSVAVLATGCKGKSEPKLLSAKTMKAEIQQFQSKDVDVDNEKSQAAIDFLKSEGVNWTGVTGKNGAYKFSNLTFENEDGVAIKSLSVSGLQMLGDEVPYASAVTIEDFTFEEGKIDEIFFNLPAAETLKGFEDLAEESSEKFMKGLIGNFMNFSGGGYMEGLTFQEKLSSATAQSPKSNVKFIGWNSDKAKMSILLEDMNFKFTEDTGSAGHGFIQHMSIRNLDMTDAGDLSGGTALASMMGQYLNIFNPFKRGYDRIAIRGMDFAVKDKEMDMKFTVPTGDVYFTDVKSGIYHQKIEFPEIKFAIDPASLADGEIPQDVFEKLDLENMVFNYQADLRIDPAQDNIKLLTGGMGWKDNFEINMTYDMDGFSNYFEALEGMFEHLMPMIESQGMGGSHQDMASVSDMEAQMKSMYSGIVINDFTVDLRDQSLLAKGFEIASSQNGQSVDDMKNAAKAVITMGTTQAPTDYTRTLSKDFMGSFNSFIDNGGTLRFSIKPETGFSIGDMVNEFEQASKGDPAAAMGAIDATLKRMKMDFEHLPQ